MHRKLVPILLCLVIIACGSKNNSDNKEINNQLYERINIIGETSNKGVYDPSIEYDTDGSVGWMAYSALESPPELIKELNPRYISTHLAKTTDNGKTWTFVKEITKSTDAEQGTWRNEVSTLVHDPDDSGKEWKIFWHKYYNNMNKDTLEFSFDKSWIAYKAASTPEGLADAEEALLFGTDKSSGENGAKYNLNEMMGNKGILLFSEPGSLYKDGILYLSLSGAPTDEIFLFSSEDHGDSWNYLGRMTSHQDSLNLGYTSLTASSLVKESNRFFLMVTSFNHRKTWHYGTYIFEFEDITKGKLKRDIKGKLIVHKHIEPYSTSPNNGQSDYDEHNTYGGIIMPQGDPSFFPQVAQIFNTKERILE